MKGGNAFLKSGAQGPSVRLGDFEFSTIEGLKIRPANIGTRSYLPPEVLTTKEWEVAPSGDMWGLGLTLLELMHGEDANFFLMDLSDEIFSKPNNVVFAKWKEIHTKIMKNLNLQDPVDGLIARLLAIDPPSSRPSATEVALKLEEVLTKEGPVVRLGI